MESLTSHFTLSTPHKNPRLANCFPRLRAALLPPSFPGLPRMRLYRPRPAHIPIHLHVPPSNLRSAEDAAVLAKAGKRARPLQGADAAAGGRSEYGRSTAVFARLQEQQDQAKAGGDILKKKGT